MWGHGLNANASANRLFEQSLDLQEIEVAETPGSSLIHPPTPS
jgi:hypothetical protein